MEGFIRVPKPYFFASSSEWNITLIISRTCQLVIFPNSCFVPVFTSWHWNLSRILLLVVPLFVFKNLNGRNVMISSSIKSDTVVVDN